MRRSSEDLTKINNMVASDDEWIPFKYTHFDGAISCINLHWVQNLKGRTLILSNNFNRVRLWAQSTPCSSKWIAVSRCYDRWKFFLRIKVSPSILIINPLKNIFRQCMDDAQIKGNLVNEFRARFSPTIRKLFMCIFLLLFY